MENNFNLPEGRYKFFNCLSAQEYHSWGKWHEDGADSNKLVFNPLLQPH